MRKSLLGALVWFTLGLVGCGVKASDPVPNDLGRASDRLQGEWVLRAFRPETPLGPVVDPLLEAQLGQLHVTMRQGAMGIHGVGLDAERSYRVVQATEDGFSGVVTDANGVGYEVTGEFRGLDLWFKSYSDPWRGSGELHRVR